MLIEGSSSTVVNHALDALVELPLHEVEDSDFFPKSHVLALFDDLSHTGLDFRPLLLDVLAEFFRLVIGV